MSDVKNIAPRDCPKCGGHDTALSGRDDRRWIECRRCDYSGPEAMTEFDAIVRWNLLVAPQPESQPAVPAQVEKPWWDHWRPESDYPEAAAPAALCPYCGKPIKDTEEGGYIHCDPSDAMECTNKFPVPAADPLCVQPAPCGNMNGSFSCTRKKGHDGDHWDQPDPNKRGKIGWLNRGPDPICCNPDCADIERLREALRKLVEEIQHYDSALDNAKAALAAPGKPLSQHHGPYCYCHKDQLASFTPTAPAPKDSE